MPVTRSSADMEEFKYRSGSGAMLRAYRWLPEGAPRGIVQIIHGIADYGARYAEFAEFLNQAGYLVVAEDHMGHGQSITKDAPQGYFKGGWFQAVDDTYQLFLDTRRDYPDVPYIFFGHSMGSFLLRTILARYPDSGIAGAVICGSAWMGKPLMLGGFAMASAVCRFQGERHYSDLLQSVMFGSYNAKIKNCRTPYDWVNRDEAMVDAYCADPLCGFTPTAGLVREMIGGLRYIHKAETLACMNKTLPVLFIAGGDDPVGDYGKGVERAAEEFRKCGMEQVDCKIYPLCRHEILNEINRKDIYQDVTMWIKSVLMDK